jgi:IMP cyclohydrolase
MIRTFKGEWQCVRCILVVEGKIVVSNGSVVRVITIHNTTVTNEIKTPMTEVTCMTVWQDLIILGCGDG